MMNDDRLFAVQRFVDSHGEAFGITPGRQPGLASCWQRHPTVCWDLIGLTVAWTDLLEAIAADGPASQAERPRVAATEWLHLTNATEPVLTRIQQSLRLCLRSGEHVAPAEEFAP